MFSQGLRVERAARAMQGWDEVEMAMASSLRTSEGGSGSEEITK